MTLEKAIARFITSRKLHGYSENTIRDYQDFLKRFLKYAGNIEVDDITLDILEDYTEYLFNHNLAKASVGTYLRHLKAFIHYLCDNGYISEKQLYTKITVPRAPKKILKIYSDMEVEKIFQSVEATPEWIRLRNCCIIAFMLDSGLRQSEVCAIQIQDIYLGEHLLKARGKGSKERIVPYGVMTSRYLEAYRSQCPYKESDILFVNRDGTPLTRNAVKLFVNRIEKTLGFELSSHKLRHNFATNYLIDQYNEKGTIDIYKLMALLGHEDIETTRRYLHIANGFIASKENISHIDRIFFP